MGRQTVPVIVHAIQARATIDRRACAANLPLLLYIACLMALVGFFASVLYGLLQPTVIIPSATVASYEVPGPTYLFFSKHDSSAEEMERVAIDAAEIENREQGLDPILAFTAVAPPAAKPS